MANKGVSKPVIPDLYDLTVHFTLNSRAISRNCYVSINPSPASITPIVFPCRLGHLTLEDQMQVQIKVPVQPARLDLHKHVQETAVTLIQSPLWFQQTITLMVWTVHPIMDCKPFARSSYTVQVSDNPLDPLCPTYLTFSEIAIQKLTIKFKTNIWWLFGQETRSLEACKRHKQRYCQIWQDL